MPPGSELAAARPPAWRRHQYLTILLVCIGLAAYFQWGGNLHLPGPLGEVSTRSGQHRFLEWLKLGTIATTFYMIFGIGGRFAFSTAAFFGVGAYASHWATRTSGHPWPVGTAVAVVIAAVIALVFGLLVRKAHHFYFAVATLGLAQLLLLLFQRIRRLTGQSDAVLSGARKMTLFGWHVDSRYRVFFVFLGMTAVMLVIAAMIERSPLARRAAAARDNERVAETLGIDPVIPGLTLFVLGSSLAALAGSVFVHARATGEPNDFGLHLGIAIFVALILGGLHSLWGGLIGALFYTFVPAYLTHYLHKSDSDLEKWIQVIWGAVLVIVMIAVPEGLVGIVQRIRNRLRRTGAEARP